MKRREAIAAIPLLPLALKAAVAAPVPNVYSFSAKDISAMMKDLAAHEAPFMEWESAATTEVTLFLSGEWT